MDLDKVRESKDIIDNYIQTNLFDINAELIKCWLVVRYLLSRTLDTHEKGVLKDKD